MRHLMQFRIHRRHEAVDGTALSCVDSGDQLGKLAHEVRKEMAGAGEWFKRAVILELQDAY
jgi:hypothetical protein